MVTAWCWVVIVPLLVINRHSHFSRIAVIETVTALEVVATPVVLWIVDIRIVVKPLHILCRLSAPGCTESSLLSLGRI